MKELLKLVELEDKRNPLTDQDIAEKLCISRSEVVRIRHTLNIGDSRERMELILEDDIQRILDENPNISERNLVSGLNEMGYRLSRTVVSRILKEKIKNLGEDEPQNDVTKDRPTSAFYNLVGAHGSLKPQIELAKAAILYPPNGLHTLIYGPTGSGKSELAECMYKFAVETGARDQKSQFVVFNCADYAENPQLLMGQLFGSVKGAYTGADGNKEGLVEKANNGILFLDEIHRLPPEGQEILFYIMDKGRFRRLGETDTLRKVNIMIIGATTENIGSTLLETFRRRIPVVIELPNLAVRPMEERLEIIRNFFRQESTRLNVKIIASYNVLRALLLYEPKGNVGQLHSDIQVACARGFLRYKVNKTEYIKIDVSDVPGYVAEGLLNIGSKRESIDSIPIGDLKINPGDAKPLENFSGSFYAFPKDIYKYIEDTYQGMESRNIDVKIINQVIKDELESKIQQLINQFRYSKNKLAKHDLSRILGDEIIEAVDIMIKIAKDKIENIDETLFFCLATHLSAAYERIRHNKPIVNPQLNQIKQEYQYEYEIAAEMAKACERHLNISIPETEIGFIAMYLKSCSKRSQTTKTGVGVVVLSHGCVASAMVDVANRLLGVEYARYVEMSLEEAPESALEKALEAVKQVDTGRGVLMLADMGSLVGFGQIITERTGIQTITLSGVNTPIVVEAVRKAMIPEAGLEEIAESLQHDVAVINSIKKVLPGKNNLKNVIICICLTGEGTAERLKGLILNYLSDNEKAVEVICIGALTQKDLINSINEAGRDKNIIAIVSTIDINIAGIPIIAAKDIISGRGISRLRDMIGVNVERTSIQKKTEGNSFEALINPSLVLINQKFKTKQEALNKLAGMMLNIGCVTEKFVVSVYQREMLGSTYFKGGVGLPHGYPEHVVKPAIGIMTLESPIEWDDGRMVDCVFMLALKEFQQNEFKKLYEVINNETILNRIKKCKDPLELREEIIRHA